MDFVPGKDDVAIEAKAVYASGEVSWWMMEWEDDWVAYNIHLYPPIESCWRSGKFVGNYQWITNENTLHVTLLRAVRQNLLTRLRKGLYVIMTPSELDDTLIGAKMLHSFCYVSTETILAREGYISHTIPYTTFVSDLSYTWKFGNHQYRSRQLAPRYLHNPEGIHLHGQVYEATIERAIVDMLYFNPFYHFDRPIDVKKVRAIQKK